MSDCRVCPCGWGAKSCLFSDIFEFFSPIISCKISMHHCTLFRFPRFSFELLQISRDKFDKFTILFVFFHTMLFFSFLLLENAKLCLSLLFLCFLWLLVSYTVDILYLCEVFLVYGSSLLCLVSCYCTAGEHETLRWTSIMKTLHYRHKQNRMKRGTTTTKFSMKIEKDHFHKKLFKNIAENFEINRLIDEKTELWIFHECFSSFVSINDQSDKN